MRELPKIFISLTLTLVAVLSLLAFLFSGNKYDFFAFRYFFGWLE